jgi:hypothetical protein
MTNSDATGARSIRGSCLCGAVRFEIRGPLGAMSHCHCAMCRKAHGAAFGTYSTVKRSDFALLSGADSIASYRSSPTVTRTFCRTCGSTLQWITDDRPDALDIAIGTLDDDPGIHPGLHIFTASKAPWFEIADGLPQHAER